jgi:hypothetical protein
LKKTLKKLLLILALPKLNGRVLKKRRQHILVQYKYRQTQQNEKLEKLFLKFLILLLPQTINPGSLKQLLSQLLLPIVKSSSTIKMKLSRINFLPKNLLLRKKLSP